jgi:hypothetical protein
MQLSRFRDPKLPRRFVAARIQHEPAQLTGLQRQSRVHVAIVGPDVRESSVVRLSNDVQGYREIVGLEDRAAVGDMQLMRLSAIVEPRCYVELERHPTPHTPQQPHQPVLVCGHVSAYGHEIDDLTDALRREEPGDQNGRIGQIHLLRAEGIHTRPYPVPAATSMIE